MAEPRKRALISVTDKTGVVEFARGLVELGFSLLSTGGTLKALAAGGVKAQEVADYTGFPELLDGRLKTLHPRVHGGLLGKRDDASHAAAMREHGIEPIDVLVVNLYRFREAAAQAGGARDAVVEQIDIGGPAMVRSAAKNHAHVAVVVDPQDYGEVLGTLREQHGALPEPMRRRLAAKAFAHTAAYDAAIAEWFAGQQARTEGGVNFPAILPLAFEKVQDLRYGENPHQRAALYRYGVEPIRSLAHATQRAGKELSFNNLLDLQAALGLALEWQMGTEPCCVIVKHNNPCGTAIAADQVAAFRAALQADPVSAFGGIVAVNWTLTAATCAAMVASGTFVEAIVAPQLEAGALAELQKAKWGNNVRVLELGGWPAATPALELRQISGGMLVQHPDVPRAPIPALTTVTKRAPTASEMAVLGFAWRVAKHVKSNAIVLARELEHGTFATVGVGAGQMSRVDSARIAVHKAGDRARGAVCASDAFFPFADGLETVAAAGVTAVIQPGGSKRDPEVIAAADAHGVAMVFTGMRHFRH